MKARRHARILEIISSTAVKTQEELQEQLRLSGYPVTQATVSRDIKELRLVKTQGENGGYCYAASRKEVAHISSKFHSIFADAVINVQYSQNIVVVQCHNGMAQAACAAMDSLHWKQIIGTLAGDDTFICITTGERESEELMLELKKMLSDAER